MADRLGIVHVEVDRVHAERGITLSGRPLLREDWIEAYRRSYRRLEQVLRAGHSGVFDATSYRRVQRQRLRRLADACGVPMTVIYLDVAAAEARRRIDANRVNSVRVNVPDEDFATVANQLQPPGEDEDWLRYDPAIPVDQWVDQVLAPFAQEQNS
jgi:predicted kinase